MPNPTYREVPIGDLRLGDHDPRGVRVRGARHNIQDLVPSVRQHGILEPILVRPNGDGFEILAGGRRYRAAKKVGLETVPCIVRKDDDRTARAVTIIENLHRQDLHPLQEAEGIARLLDEEGFTMMDVAAVLGLPLSTVARRAKLRELHPLFRKLYTQEDSPVAAWTIRHLELCASYPRTTQAAVAEQLAGDPWERPETVRELRQWLEHDTLRLDNVPWKLDDADLVPDAGPCSACPMRSGVEQLLFEDLERDNDSPRCLDGACHRGKLVAWLQGRVSAAQEQHGEALVLVSRRYRGASDDLPAFGLSVRSTDGFDVHPEGAKDRVPAVVVEAGSGLYGEGVGELVWLAARGGTPTREAVATTGDDQSLEAKLERSETLLRRKRLRHAVGALLEQADGVPPPSRIKLLRLAALFGGLGKRDHRWNREGGDLPKSLCNAAARKAPSTLWVVFEAARDDAAVAAIAWAGIQGTIAARLDLRNSFDDFEAVEAEARSYAGLLRLSWDALWDGARQACPPSKALCRRRDALRAARVA